MIHSSVTMIAGVSLVGLSVWVLMISESILLAKVQNEMQVALDSLSRKKEREVEEVLSYLRESRIVSGQNPLDNLDSAINFISNLPHAAFILGPSFGIISSNRSFANLLGYEEGTLNGRPAHEINDKVVMSIVGDLVTRPEHKDSLCYSMRYVYKHRDSSNVFGSLHVLKAFEGCFIMVFHPDSAMIVSQKELEGMLNVT